MTVIADDAGPEALGGIMGGEHSAARRRRRKCSWAALFDPVRTATGHKLGISLTRYRFGQGVDPAFVGS